MWPFDRGGGLLALYVATLALHAVFVGYVVVGTAYVLVQTARRRADALADLVRERLPFMLGCGITAGVAPLLFEQLLYQRRFYTANLLLGPRWLAVVPALVVGFYALYLGKTSARWRRVALGVALACFAFVAWSWSELHELMQADADWRAFYAGGQRLFLSSAIVPRLVAIVGGMVTLFAAVTAWSTDHGDAQGRRRLATAALIGRLAAAGGAAWLWRDGFVVEESARAWLWVLAASVAIEVGAWLMVRAGDRRRALIAACAAGGLALIATIVVREAPRVALIEPPRPLADGAGGVTVFAAAALVGVLAIVWIVRVVRAASTGRAE